ncbi:YncE family protein [Paenibacillus elgii]|uniref:YncE family protein n=1 Tax=Paenibacillus elgii TaxID=189691 RepID=UPI000248CC93|nr:hypothetical protein [Paenibacillus elgii]
MRYFMIVSLTLLILAGCSDPIKDTEPIGENMKLVVHPFTRSLSVVDTEKFEIIRTIPLGRFVIDYATAPNGKIYIPLHDDKGDKESYVAVLDPKTGSLKKIPNQYGSEDFITITKDGTAFIRTGIFTNVKDNYTLLMDTESDQVIGTVMIPGAWTRMERFSDTQVIVGVNNPENGTEGNVFIVDRNKAVPIFPESLHPRAPFEIRYNFESGTAYFLYNGVVDEPLKQRYMTKTTDMRTLEAHIDVWNLKTLTRIKQIYLPFPRVSSMVLDSRGMLYVGNRDVSPNEPMKHVLVINPSSGHIRQLETVRSPESVHIDNDRLYVGSGIDGEMDIFQLPNLEHVKRISSFKDKVYLPIVTIN